MGASASLWFVSITICIGAGVCLAHWRTVRFSPVALVGTFGVLAFAFSAVSPDDDMLQQEYVRGVTFARVLSQPRKIGTIRSAALEIVKKVPAPRIHALFGTALVIGVIPHEVFQTEILPDRAPPSRN
jgi:hypothetical protein